MLEVGSRIGEAVETSIREASGVDAYTHLNLGDIDDAGPRNGFADRWQARAARSDLDSDQSP